MLKRYGVDGFMYAKMSNRITHVPDALKDAPVVLVDATDAEGRIPSVEPDEIMIAKDATNRLIHAGCRRIAYIGCSEPMIAQDLRKEGYRQALEEAGIGYDGRLVIDVLNNRPALDEVRELFDRENPDGFFCFNDARSWPVYECAARRGLTVGKDISVVGVDKPSRHRRDVLPAADHGGTAALRDGVLGGVQADLDDRGAVAGRCADAGDASPDSAAGFADSREDSLHVDREGVRGPLSVLCAAVACSVVDILDATRRCAVGMESSNGAISIV